MPWSSEFTERDLITMPANELAMLETGLRVLLFNPKMDQIIQIVRTEPAGVLIVSGSGDLPSPIVWPFGQRRARE